MALAGALLCGGCRRDEPDPAPERRPALPPAEAGGDREPAAEPEPAEPSVDALEAMADEARRRTTLSLYYTPYVIECRIGGGFEACFGDLVARYLLVMGYGDGASYTRRAAASDRWSLFFGGRSGALAVAAKIEGYEAEALRRPLYPEEEAELSALRLELDAAERAALADFRLELLAEVAGRRFRLAEAGPGSLLSAPPVP